MSETKVDILSDRSIAELKDQHARLVAFAADYAEGTHFNRDHLGVDTWLKNYKGLIAWAEKINNALLDLQKKQEEAKQDQIDRDLLVA